MTNYQGLYGYRSYITAEQEPHKGVAQAADVGRARQRRQQPGSRKDHHHRRLRRRICHLHNIFRHFDNILRHDSLLPNLKAKYIINTENKAI